MAEKRNLRGFTRADALVAGVMCLVLVLLVPVLLGKPRERSIRMVCAANLAQIGKTMFIYANDYEGILPRAGGRTTMWGPTWNWTAATRHQAFGLNVSGDGGSATISSSFYLLVKYYQAPTRLFLCPGDKGTTEFKLSDMQYSIPANFELMNAWDFGPAATAYKSCSFSYHTPYNTYALTTSRDPNLAVAADRSPWIASPASAPASLASFRPDLPGATGTPEQARRGNARAHASDGQNVLFLDGRVTFETRSYCGIGGDNIYLLSNTVGEGSPVGIAPATTYTIPTNRKDSVLVHDPNVWHIHKPTR